MKRLLKVSLIVFCLYFCLSLYARAESVQITGIIKGLQGREVVLLSEDMKTELARVKGNNDTFVINADVMIGDGRVYHIYVPALGTLGPSMHIPSIYFFIDNDHISVNLKIEKGNLKTVSIQHSPMMEDYNLLYKENVYQKQIGKASIEYEKAFHAYNDITQTDNNLKVLHEKSKTLDETYQNLYERFFEMIPSHNKSDALLMILYPTLISSDSIPFISEALSKFDAECVANNYYAKLINKKIEHIKGCQIGAIAQDVELVNLKGEKCKFSSLRGQYVLVDFWASWCGPCRKELPNVKKLYAKYHCAGLQVVGVSIDDNTEKWETAVKEEGLMYTQWRDPNKQSLKLYNFNGIPFIILLGPDGKILAKNLRGDELEREVSKYIHVQPYNINVKLAKPYKGKVYLSCIKNRFTLIDSLAVDGDSFMFTGNIAKTDQYRISSRPYVFDINICVEPGCNYSATTNDNKNFFVDTENGKEQLLMNEYSQAMAPYDAKCEQLSIRYSELKNKGKNADFLNKDLNNCFKESERSKASFIKKYPNSFSAILVADQLISQDFPFLRDINNELDSVKYADSYYYKSFKNKYLEVKNKWIQNKKAPDFTTKDINGKNVRLSDFIGKYVLLDFWASWCHPCRLKMKELKKVYSQLKEKGFEVLSISLDENRSLWEKASQEDKVIWTNTCDLKPFKDNNIAQLYKVTNVPTLFLIDKNGIIIKQNPSIEELLTF
jgi:peroxiredoxin